MTSASEQTSASNDELIEALKYALERIMDFDPKGDEYLSKLLEHPSPQQQPNMLVDYEIVDSHNGTVHLKLFHLPRTFVDRVLKLLGQPDELSKAAEDVQLLKQQRIHDMNRISDLETTLKAHPDKLSTYFDLVQARRELSKAQERVKELEERVKYLEGLAADRLSRILNNEP